MVARTRRARVTGLGGIFFKAKDPKALVQWYRRHLGMDIRGYGGPHHVEGWEGRGCAFLLRAVQAGRMF